MKFNNSLSLTISKSAKKKKGLKYLDFFISQECCLLLTCICVFTGVLANAISLVVSLYLAVVACIFLHSYKYNLE